MKDSVFIVRCLIKLAIALLLSATFTSVVFAQCIDRKNIDGGDDGLFYNYGYLTPSYFFSFGGDTSKKWNIGFENIDIRQAPVVALQYKSKVEKAIKKYAGSNFFKDLKFENLMICYPERLKSFIDSGAVLVTLKHYKSKYTFNYRLASDTMIGYGITIAVDDHGNIITPFIFPSKHFYKPLDKTVTYCKLMDMARKVQKKIDSIDNITFEYDKKKKRFYWRISQALVNDHEGENFINEVIIDASDLKKVSVVRSSRWVIY